MNRQSCGSRTKTDCGCLRHAGLVESPLCQKLPFVRASLFDPLTDLLARCFGVLAVNDLCRPALRLSYQAHSERPQSKFR
jgi:hypothetical protein